MYSSMKMWKKAAALMLVLCMIVGLTACAGGSAGETETTTRLVENTAQEYDSFEAAIAASGTAFGLPANISAQPTTYAAIGSILEVTYGENREIVIRKAPGNEDVSGDTTEYAVVKQLDVNGTWVTVKGPAEGAWNLILWLSEDATYAISLKEAVNDEAVATWVSMIK